MLFYLEIFPPLFHEIKIYLYMKAVMLHLKRSIVKRKKNNNNICLIMSANMKFVFPSDALAEQYEPTTAK